MFRPALSFVVSLVVGGVLCWAQPTLAQSTQDGLLTPADIKYCAEVGQVAHSTARARDAGVSLTKLLALPPVAGQGPATTKLLQSIKIDVYQHSWWTPAYARQQWEVPCLSGSHKP